MGMFNCRINIEHSRVPLKLKQRFFFDGSAKATSPLNSEYQYALTFRNKYPLVTKSLSGTHNNS